MFLQVRGIRQKAIKILQTEAEPTTEWRFAELPQDYGINTSKGGVQWNLPSPLTAMGDATKLIHSPEVYPVNSILS